MRLFQFVFDLKSAHAAFRTEHPFAHESVNNMATAEVADDTGPVKFEEKYSNWMGGLSPHLHNIPLCKLAIPGSHESGSYALKKDWGVSPDADTGVKNLSSIPIIGAMAKDIIHRWGKCQNMTVLEQLNSGVRYFDFRVAYHEESEDFYLTHGLYGPKISDILQEVLVFLTEHPKEVVLLDFNHFFSMELEHHIQLITQLISVFQGRLCPVSSTDKTSLAALWQNNMQAIIFYQHDIVSEFEDLWPAASIASPWARTMDPEQCLLYQENEAKKQRCDRKFHVCQAVLTPTTQTIMQKFMSSAYAECAQKMNYKIPGWLCSDRLKDCHGIIYSADFVEEGDFVQGVIALNK